MSKRNRFRIVTAILMLLLIAAIGNYFFVNQAFDVTQKSLMQAAPEPRPQNPDVSGSPMHHPPMNEIGGGQPVGPTWYGDMYLTPASQSSYDIVVEAFGNGSRSRVPVDTVEIDIRQPGDAAAQISPSVEKVEEGKYISHTNFPSSGTWEVRVRMHRGYQTLDFAEKFDIKN